TYIGANAEIDGATIEPGAIVSPLARVGPGVTLPAGMLVLPGKNITTQAQASDPALGKVVPATPTDATRVTQALTSTKGLAAGYTILYQGNSATGVSPGVSQFTTGVFNGNLAVVRGAGLGPSSRVGPRFLAPRTLVPRGPLSGGYLDNFRARVTGQAAF